MTHRIGIGNATIIFVAIAIVGVLVAGFVNYGSISNATQTLTVLSTSTTIPTSSNGGTYLIQVVTGSAMTPVGGMSVVAGPTSSPNDIFDTPGGPTLNECINSTRCPLDEYTTNASGWVSIPEEANASFYFIKAGNVNQWNDLMVGAQPNSTIRMIFPLPSGNITIPDGQSCESGSGRNFTSTCFNDYLPVYWPPTTGVSCGGGLPNESAVVPQGVYAGRYIAYSYAVYANNTKVALSSYCPGYQIGQITGTGAMVAVEGTVTVPNGTGPGTFALAVFNRGNSAITSVTVSVDAADSGVTATSGGSVYTAGGPTFTLYGGNLPVGKSASEVVQMSGAVAGDTYTFTVTMNFSADGTEVQTLAVTAQI